MPSPRDATWSRAITCAFVLAVAVRYLVWRFFSTVLPYPMDWSFGFLWTWFVFLVELGAFADILLFLVAMSRYVNRSAEADRLERDFFARDAADLPTVDVFIPTYNEPLDVLERTIVGALALDYPKDKLKIYVLDDKVEKEKQIRPVLVFVPRATYRKRLDLKAITDKAERGFDAEFAKAYQHAIRTAR